MLTKVDAGAWSLVPADTNPLLQESVGILRAFVYFWARAQEEDGHAGRN